MSRSRERLQRDAANARILFLEESGVPGVFVAIATLACSRAPAALVWYCLTPGRVEIINSYTVCWARRLGLRGKLHDAMRGSYPDKALVTNEASGEAARQFLESRGFLQTPEGYWHLPPAGDPHE